MTKIGFALGLVVTFFMVISSSYAASPDIIVGKWLSGKQTAHVERSTRPKGNIQCRPVGVEAIKYLRVDGISRLDSSMIADYCLNTISD